MTSFTPQPQSESAHERAGAQPPNNRTTSISGKKVPAAIAVATAYVAFYHISPHIGVASSVTIALFFLSPFVVGYMAYVILKHGEPSPHTFEEKFYDDLSTWRAGKGPAS